MSSLRLGEGMRFPPPQSEHIIWQQEQCGPLSQTNLQERFWPPNYAQKESQIGGKTLAVATQNAFEKFNFVSTAGGAFLEYLEGKEIAGIRALK